MLSFRSFFGQALSRNGRKSDRSVADIPRKVKTWRLRAMRFVGGRYEPGQASLGKPGDKNSLVLLGLCLCSYYF